MKKRGLAFLLALCMMCAMTGCAQNTNETTAAPTSAETTAAPAETTEAQTTEAASEGTFAAGSYTAAAAGMKGDITVEVTFSEDSITEVAVKDHAETFGIGWGLDNTPIETVPGWIVENQSLAVDTVTGATITTYALKKAVSDCVEQAGGDVKALEAVQVEKPASAGEETYDVDVVVVGAGAAGLSAANTALEAGANVLLLEKQSITGGSTARSGGKVLAAGTPWMEKQNQEMDPQLLYDYLLEVGGDFIDESLLKPFVFNSAENLQWLEDRGVMVQDVEEVHSNLPVWWVHNTQGGGGMTDGHGGQISVPLTRAYEENGGVILYNTAATSLEVDGNGAVTGVKAQKSDGTAVTVNAKAVILCSGGYAQNRDMIARIPGDEGYISNVPMSNVGDGIVMAQAVGAKVFDSPSAAPVFVDLTCGVGGGEMGGLMVSAQGERIVNEYTYQFHTGLAIEATGTPYGYYIATANDPNELVQYGMTLESTAQASSLEELAEITGMDKDTFVAAVERYNELCAKGEDEDFGKRPDHLWPIEGETYYAFKMVPIISFTLGGLCIDPEGHVMNVDDQPIAGLYAAGEVAFSGLIGDDYPSCGMAIGSAVYYGRIAAANAVAGK
ncbi:MAG: FAD-dependent oxidoreductase [Lachnospiraceae bacterium]|nr:FAD-dependent oxidoreductase [Lachnospiraceae bacterium]